VQPGLHLLLGAVTDTLLPIDRSRAAKARLSCQSKLDRKRGKTSAENLRAM
jgi:hypothetical protein